MKRILVFHTVQLVLAVLVAGSAQGQPPARGAEPSLTEANGPQRRRAPQGLPQVVVLHNGSVVQGRVEKYREHLIVSQGPWYEVRIPLEDVDLIAADFETAYRTKRARLDERDFAQHYQLSQWCLRHDLNRFASDELLLLTRLEPHHSAVRALERDLLRRANRQSETAAANASPSPSDSAPQSAPPDTAPPVSADALADFSRSIQPLLLNRCGQTTCHGRAGTSGFLVERLNASGSARQELTWRNLRSALAQLDPNEELASPLMQYATQPHGGIRQAPIGLHEVRQHQTLVNWVKRVVKQQAVPEPDAEVAVAAYDAPITHDATTPVSPAEWFQANSSDDSPPQGAEVDPYDPSSFNANSATADAVGDDLR